MTAADCLVDQMVAGAPAAADDIEPHADITVRPGGGFPV
jgi:hypothetical protein